MQENFFGQRSVSSRPARLSREAPARTSVAVLFLPAATSFWRAVFQTLLASRFRDAFGKLLCKKSAFAKTHCILRTLDAERPPPAPTPARRPRKKRIAGRLPRRTDISETARAGNVAAPQPHAR